MRIAVTIDHEFDSLELFADFSAKLKDLFHQFGYNSGAAVRVVETPAAAPTKRAAPALVSTAIASPVGDSRTEETSAELTEAATPLPVVHDLPAPEAPVTAPATSVPASGEAVKKTRVRRTKVQIAADNAREAMEAAARATAPAIATEPVAPIQAPAPAIAQPLPAAVLTDDDLLGDTPTATAATKTAELDDLLGTTIIANAPAPIGFVEPAPVAQMPASLPAVSTVKTITPAPAVAPAKPAAPAPKPVTGQSDKDMPEAVFTSGFMAAMKTIGPAKMAAILARQGIGGLHQIPADKRAAFLDILKAEMAAVTAAPK